MSRKTFAPSQPVEIWRHVFGRWDPAVYLHAAGTPGCHVVEFGGGPMEVATRNVRARGCRNIEARTPWRVCVLAALHKGCCCYEGGEVSLRSERERS